MRSNRWCFEFFALTLVFLSACASVSQPNHKFDFDPRKDSPDVRVLDWRYSEYGPFDWEYSKVAKGESFGLVGLNVTGRFPAGEFIYVKWQVPPDPTIHERRIELKGLLPWSMEGNRLVLMFRSAQPHVYLVEHLKGGTCPGSACPMTLPSDTEKIARVFMSESVKQIYPGPPTPIVIPFPQRPSE
jgi:hypothetical protein